MRQVKLIKKITLNRAALGCDDTSEMLQAVFRHSCFIDGSTESDHHLLACEVTQQNSNQVLKLHAVGIQAWSLQVE